MQWFDIIDNYKTYAYHDAKSDSYYTPIKIPSGLSKKDEINWVKDKCVNQLHYLEVNIQDKKAYFDPPKNTYWWKTSKNNEKVISAIKNGGSARFNNDILKERYDNNNNMWLGYQEFFLKKRL